MKKGVILGLIVALGVPTIAAVTPFGCTQSVNFSMLDNYLSSGTEYTTWYHDVPEEALGKITFARLTINVDDFCDTVYDVSITLNDVYLGKLTGETTVFTSEDENNEAILTAFLASTPTTATINVHSNDLNSWGQTHIVSSTLYGEYVSVVPAPGAIVLAGLGTLTVGWLRRRKTV